MRTAQFQIRIIFALTTLIGLCLLPYINVRLNPSPQSHSLTVHYNYPSAGAELLEREVTSPLERMLARLDQLTGITSTSRDGDGQIQLTFDPAIDIDQARLEVSTIIRQLRSALPPGVSYPRISYQSRYEEYPVLLSYQILINSASQEVEQVLDQVLVRPLSRISGVHTVDIHGIPDFECVVVLQADQLKDLHLNESTVREVLQRLAAKEDLGHVIEQDEDMLIPVLWSARGSTGHLPATLAEWPIANIGNRKIYLKDIAQISLRRRPVSRFYRIKGQEYVTMSIRTDPSVNQITLARQIKKIVGKEMDNGAQNFQILLQRDRSAYLAKELSKIGIRILLALGLLFLFMALIYRRQKILGALILGFVCTLATSVICYYFLDLELHLYSLAGLTLSLGIVLDNLIVMAGHLRKKGNQRIFIALLAATLTTVGALSIIFFISPQYREQLTDFALIFFINIGISLVVALFLLPVLIRPLPTLVGRKSFHRLRRFNHFFYRYISWNSRRKWIVICVMLFAFGLPLYLLPTDWEGEGVIPSTYRELMEGYYGREIHPVFSKYLGGTLRLFTTGKDQFFFQQREKQETKLFLEAKMPFGGTTTQLNQIVVGIEKYLLQYPEISHFESRVSGPYNSRIEISFADGVVDGIFPYQLKSKLEGLAIGHGSADFRVYGVGRGFTNEMYGGGLSTHLKLSGYQYDQIWKVAEQARLSLLEHVRIQKVYINPTLNYNVPSTEYYQMVLDQGARHVMDIPADKLLTDWSDMDPDRGIVQYLPHEGQSIPVRLMNSNTRQNERWLIEQALISIDTNRYYKNTGLARLEKRKGSNNIVRSDQQYQLFIEYDFIGNHRLAERVKERALKTIRSVLPPGYYIDDQSYRGWWTKSKDKMVHIVLGSCALIFLISTILFNSLRQALISLLLIPPAFIGVFLVTYFLDFRFDQGGFAAMLLVAGLSVNAGIFIINDYNIIKAKRPALDRAKAFISAYNAKFMPIMLTALSTALGLLPFIFFEKHEPFWYSLAVCTCAGLIFSFMGLFFLLPVFFGPDGSYVESPPKLQS